MEFSNLKYLMWFYGFIFDSDLVFNVTTKSVKKILSNYYYINNINSYPMNPQQLSLY